MIAIVPVRKGSERVLDKNIKTFAGSSLLEIKLKQLMRVGLFENVFVTSDCEKMLTVAAGMGASTHKRDDLYCKAHTPMSEVYKYLGHEFKDYQEVAYINVTNPLLQDKTLMRCVKGYTTHGDDVMSVNTVHDVKDFMWLNGKPVNYDPYNQPRSQDLPNYYALNFACNIIKTSVMRKHGVIVGAPHMAIVIDKVQALDIDDVYDFEIAETLYKRTIDERGSK